jgi:hypothetical protein
VIHHNNTRAKRDAAIAETDNKRHPVQPFHALDPLHDIRKRPIDLGNVTKYRRLRPGGRELIRSGRGSRLGATYEDKVVARFSENNENFNPTIKRS